MKKKNLIWIVPILGLAIAFYTSIVIKWDAVKYTVKSNDNITLQNPSTITKPKPRRRPKPKISSITFAEIDALYDEIDYTGCTTKLQKEERFKLWERMIKRNYIGKLVQWTGKVVSVGTTTFSDELYVKFNHTENSLSDVTVYFPDSARYNLLKLQKDTWVTYQGRIKSIKNVEFLVILKNHHLTDGKIIRVQRN